MKKLFCTLCLATSILMSASGCVNTSEGYAQGPSRNPGAVVNDAGITAEIKSKFLADSDISGFKIDVDTYKGIVTLTGMVPSRQALNKAVDIARKTNGVQQVIPRLEVRPNR